MGNRECDSKVRGADLSPERFEAVLSSISDGVFTIDRDGRIACFNRAAEEITGFCHDEAIGRPCHEIFRANRTLTWRRRAAGGAKKWRSHSGGGRRR